MMGFDFMFNALKKSNIAIALIRLKIDKYDQARLCGRKLKRVVNTTHPIKLEKLVFLKRG